MKKLLIVIACLSIMGCAHKRIPFSAASQGFQIAGNQESGQFELDLPQSLTSGIAVIEHVSIRVQQKQGSKPHVYYIATATNPEGAVRNNLDLPQEGGTGGGPISKANWQASETVRLYHRLNGAVPLSIRYGRTGDAAPDDDVFVVEATVSGYIVPTGAASLAP